MSFDAISWAMAQQIKSSAKFVLVAMADRVNGSAMVCWPSYADLTHRTCQDVKTVQAGLKRLREAGLIEDTGERRGSTGQVIVYRLTTPKNGVVQHLDNTTENGCIEALNTPESGGVSETSNTPVFPDKTPVFPVKDPQISHERPPKTGDGTSKEPVKEPVRNKRESASASTLVGVPDSLFRDYMAVRKAKNAGPLTETAVAALIREAGKSGLTLPQAVTACCEFSWIGFNAGWYEKRTGSKPTTQSRHSGLTLQKYSEGVNADGTFA